MNKRFLIIPMLLLLGLGLLQAQFAQSLFFSEYVEGSSNNKAIEIFNGTGVTVDLSTVTVKLGSNGGTWSATNIITLSGSLAHGEVYVIANAGANAAILAQSDVTSTVTYFNGDDALGLFVGETMVDVFGVYQSDPGTAWPVAGVADATLNHTLVRKPQVVSGVTDWVVSAGTNVDDSQWIVQSQDYVDDLGMHTFTPGGGDQTATPVITPGTGVYTTPQSVSITCSTAGATIYYTTDGNNPTQTSSVFSAPISVTGNTTIKAMAVAPAMDPSYIATAVYTYPVVLPTVLALRQAAADNTTIYQLSAEVYLSFQQTFRNQKYFQDDQAGFLVDDLAGVITTPLNVGDGVEGLVGKLSEYGGMLQFIPTSNTFDVTSTENPIIPVQISYTDLIDNFDLYESRVVKVMNVSFSDATGNFANGITYPSFDDNDDFPIRTTFYDVDYIGSPVPTSPRHISGIPNSRTDGAFFTPRSLADFELPAGDVATPLFSPAGGLYFSPQTVTISTTTAGASIYYTIDGSTPSSASTLYSAPITISTTTTLKAIATLGTQLSGVNTAVYSFPLQVSSLSQLAELPVGDTVYQVTGDVNLTYQQSYRHQKFVQDPANDANSRGIMIDDFNGVITTTYNVGDLITGLTGRIGEYGGQRQFVPVADPGPATGFQVPTAYPVSIADLAIWITNPEAGNNLPARLLRIYPASFVDPAGNFATGQVYALTDQDEATVNFRTSFYDADYIGSPIPTGAGVFTGIVNLYSGEYYFTARSAADLLFYSAPIDFAASYVPPTSVEMSWSWPGEVPDYVTGYYVYRNGIPYQWFSEPLTLSYTDLNIVIGNTYEYQIYAQCNGSYLIAGGSAVVTATDSDDPSAPILETALLGNYPNPFNPSTTLSFSLVETSPVELVIFNARGQRVRSLVNRTLSSGMHSVVWDGRDEQGQSASSGIYFYRMHTGKYSSTRKMIMMK
ncbi:MAG: chitobiase/beta-hexosaminidase C-terminal domain-containing protein [Candidatus Cloacimonadota bacterium]